MSNEADLTGQYWFGEQVTWRIAAELARRHPARLWVVEHNAHMYDLLDIVSAEPRGVGRVSMNRSGGSIAAGWFAELEESTEEDRDAVDRWPSYLRAGDRAAWLRRFEHQVGLRAPVDGLPPSTPTSLVIRFIALYLSAAAMSQPAWTAVSGFLGDDYDVFLREDLMKTIPGVHERWREKGGDIAAAEDVWMLMPRHPEDSLMTYPRTLEAASLALWKDGLAMRADGRTWQIDTEYQAQGRSLVAVLGLMAQGLLR